MNIAVFGSSLLSTYWNGAATYYRGVLAALARQGHRIAFYEPDAFDRQQHRDLDRVSWAETVVWQPGDEGEVLRHLERAAREADVLVKASGIGVHDELLETALPAAKRAGALAVYWDVDAPATLARLEEHARDPLRAALPRYDLVLTYGGGEGVVRRYLALGASACSVLYNALDPTTHHPVPPNKEYACGLSFLGNRLPDRDERVRDFFVDAAERLPRERFLLGGNGWDDVALPPNVRAVGHVPSADHNAFHCSARFVLNVCRASMAAAGHSPATRVFEAAGAGACIVTDPWDGIEAFLEPGREVLVAQDGGDVAAWVNSFDPATAQEIGARALRRVLHEHTYQRRGRQLHALLEGRTAAATAPALAPS